MKKRIGIWIAAWACFGMGWSEVWGQSMMFRVLHHFLAVPHVWGQETQGMPGTNSDGANSEAGVIFWDGALYGTTVNGGSAARGTIFRLNADGSGFSTLYDFTNGIDGGDPFGTLTASGSKLFGTATFGGENRKGSVFALSTNGAGFTNLHNFTGGDGEYPSAGLLLAGDTLYGDAEGGPNGTRTIFSLKTDGTAFTNLYSFPASTNNSGPMAPLIINGSTLYGNTPDYLFRMNSDGSGFTNLHRFSGGEAGGYAVGGLNWQSNTLFGATSAGGSNAGNFGLVFRIDTDGSNYTVLHNFDGARGGLTPWAGPTLAGNTLFGTTVGNSGSGPGTVYLVNVDGTGFTTLHTFTKTIGAGETNSDGGFSFASLLLEGTVLYGTGNGGGSGGSGTVFALTLGSPTLGIAQEGSQVEVSWTEPNLRWGLQTTTNLGAGDWSDITEGVSVNGTNRAFRSEGAGGRAFFRLKSQ